MDLNSYINPVRRRWWLLVAATLIAATFSNFTVIRQPANFQAHTSLMVGNLIEDLNPSQGEFSLAQQLAQNYAIMANREPVREAAMDALEMNWLPNYVVRALPNSQLIEITVTDVDPLRAQVVANELANQLVLRSPSSLNSEDQERRNFIESQLKDLERQIDITQEEIIELQAQLGTLNSARQLQDTQNQIAILQAQLTTLQGNYATLLSNTQQGAMNTLTIFQSAELPNNPIGPNKLRSILLSTAIGLFLAVGAAYLLEYMDDTLKSPEDINQLLELPVIGFIGEAEEPEGNRNGLYVLHYPRSPISESYRALRSSLKFMGVDKPLKSILVTSVDVDAGKTSVATNLSVVIAQGDRKVILMDADLRRPSIHEFFALDNDYGLTGIFQNGLNVREAMTLIDDGKLNVITSGESPPNPSELLASDGMDLILGRLEELSDLVIIDSPPSIVSDTIDLGSKVDGVLIVIRPGFTRKKIAKAIIEQFAMANARILGVVFNRIPQKELVNYDSYYYDRSYYSDANHSEGVDKLDGRGYLQKYVRGIKRGIYSVMERYIIR